MNWKFWERETRSATDSYADAVVAAILASAQGKTLATPTATAALEACAGLIGRAFAAAEVKAMPMIESSITPDCLEMIGRQLIRRGESVFLIEVLGGELVLHPVQSWDVEGMRPRDWQYRVTIGGPSRTETYEYVPAQQVLHFRYATDPERPHRGNSPLGVASLAGKLSAETIKALGDEASGPVGRLLGIPKDGDDDSVAGLKTDIKDARGRVALIESGDWDAAGAAGVQPKTERFGAEPPDSLVDLEKQAFNEVVAACGLNPALWSAEAAATVREAWRLALFSVIAPLGHKVQAELRMKIDDTLTLSWQELRASDLSGRARAFQSMVGGGMDVAQAVSVAGLMVEDA